MIRNVEEIFNLLHHSSRVGILSFEIAVRMGLDEFICKKAYIAGTIHDVGKFFLPDEVINKPSHLTSHEVKFVKKHVSLGATFLREYPIDEDVLIGIEDHHECMNGSGYPSGKVGREISLIGRILAVADRFDAMTSDRVYRKALSYEEAITCLIGELDEIDVEVFKGLLESLVCDGSKPIMEEFSEVAS